MPYKNKERLKRYKRDYMRRWMREKRKVELDRKTKDYIDIIEERILKSKVPDTFYTEVEDLMRRIG